MRIAVPRSPTSPLLWFAVLGAPIAWSAQFAASYWITQARCSVAGERWGVSVDAWAVGLTVIAALLAVAAGYVAVSLFRATQEADLDDAPPDGRTRFFAAIGMTVTPIFLAIIVLNGIGVLAHGCGQS
jgi:hypothetical protein